MVVFIVRNKPNIMVVFVMQDGGQKEMAKKGYLSFFQTITPLFCVDE